MRFALIQDGLVKNIIKWDGNTETWSPPEGCTTVEIDDDALVGPGFSYDGEMFAEPVIVEPVPLSVTPLQMRKALRAAGLKPLVDQFISSLDEEAMEEWEYATAIDRYNPTLTNAATLMGMNEAQLDDLFRLAATLS